MNYYWKLTKKVSVEDTKIVDKNGAERYADMDLVKRFSVLSPYKVAGPYGRGVGNLFYGGKLGNTQELREQGNNAVNNRQILEMLGFEKIPCTEEEFKTVFKK